MSKDWKKTLIYFFLVIFPVIDMTNGFIQLYLKIGVSIGMLYRVMFIVLLLIIDLPLLIREKNIFFTAFIIYLFVSILFHKEALISDDLVEISRIVIFPLLYLALKKMYSEDKNFKNKCLKLLDFYMLIFPLTIIIPYFLHIGFSSYGDAGYVGFYIGVNAISTTITILCTYALYKIIYKPSLSNFFIFVLNIFSLLLLGTKSGYIIIGLSFIVMIFYDYYKYHIFRTKLYSKIILLICIGLIMVFLLRNEIKQIFIRWEYFKDNRTFISFLSSGRTERIIPIIKFIMNSDYKFEYILFGYGAINNKELIQYLTEMDYFDLLFSYGFLGFLLYICMIASIIKRKTKTADFVFTFLSVAIVLISFFVGHVVTNALTNTIFALICVIENERRCNRGENCIMENKLSRVYG